MLRGGDVVCAFATLQDEFVTKDEEANGEFHALWFGEVGPPEVSSIEMLRDTARFSDRPDLANFSLSFPSCFGDCGRCALSPGGDDDWDCS